MSEPLRVTDPTPRSARIARTVARPAPGLATAVLCALALAFAGAQAILGPSGTPSPAQAQAQAQAHGKVVPIAAPACKPRRDARRSSRTRKPRAVKAGRARCVRRV